MGQKLTKTSKKTTLNNSTIRTLGKALKGIVILGMILVLILSSFAGAKILEVAKNAPKVNIAKFASHQSQSVILDDKGVEIDKVITPEVRIPVALKDVSRAVKDAFLSTEDERFYQHKGVDFKRTIGVTMKEAVSKILGVKGDQQGGSTLTQQLVKSFYLSPKKDYSRKIQEMYLALQVEKNLEKDKILEVYLNNTFLGGRAYGIEAAAKQYFSKNAKDLNVLEAAYLAGVPKAPTVFYAFSRANKKDPSAYIDRTKVVLEQMYKNKKITKEQKDGFYKQLDTKGIPFKASTLNNYGAYNYEYFTRPVVEQVKKDLSEKYKITEEEASEKLASGGLVIKSTMNTQFQQTTQKILNEPERFRFKESVDKNGVVQPQVAAVITDPSTGHVKAVIGGRGEQAIAGPNRALGNGFLRSIGSTTKPLTVYAAGIDKKIIDAGSVFDDTPLTLEQREKWYAGDDKANPKDPTRPGNATGKFEGYTTVRDATKRSSNMVAIKAQWKVTNNVSKEYAEKFGLVLPPEKYRGTSMYALGQYENIDGKDGGNPLILASAYGTFSNKGIRNEPILYTKVLDSSGNVLLENKPKATQVLSKGTAYIMWDILKDTTDFFAPGAKIPNIEVGGKTGTTQDGRELWYAGTSPYYSCAIFVGSDDHALLTDRQTGGPLFSNVSVIPVWGEIMKQIHVGLAPKTLPIPEDITKVEISKDSGNLPTTATRLDPRRNRVYSEWFLKDRVPKTFDDVHVLYKGRSYITRKDKVEVPITDQKYVLRNYSYINSPDYFETPINTTPTEPTEPTEPDTNEDPVTSPQEPDTSPITNPIQTQPRATVPITVPKNTKPSTVPFVTKP